MDDDLNDPRISAYRPQRRLILPAPPGKRQKMSEARRKALRAEKARADARATRLHLVGLTDAAVIIAGLVLAAVIIMLVVVVLSRH